MDMLKGRTLEPGQVVEVYFNLHKKVFSIRDKKTGLVVAHSPSVSLVNVKYKVSKAGRARVLREQKKNVHALIVGEFAGTVPTFETTAQGYYNPYLYESFVDKETKQQLKESKAAYCVDKQFYYKGGM
jgi:hypothetical protein